MDHEGEVSWTDQIENLLSSEGERCGGWAIMHTSSFHRMFNYKNSLTFAVSLITVVSGTASASFGMFPIEPSILAISFGLATVAAGFFNLIERSMNFGARAEGHRIASKSYSRLHNFIRLELALPRNQRNAPHSILQTLRDQTDRLHEITPPIPKDIRDAYMESCADDVARPEILGAIDPILVFRDTTPPFKQLYRGSLESHSSHSPPSSIPTSGSVNSTPTKVEIIDQSPTTTASSMYTAI